MTSLITPAEAQAMGAGLALGTTDLQALIDREEAELVRRFGAHYTATAITETATGGMCALYLKRAITSVTSIAETFCLGDTPQALAAADYYVWASEGRITRLPETTRWGRLATVVYVPQDDTNLRKMVLIELVRIGAEQRAAPSGSWEARTASGVQKQVTWAATNWRLQREQQFARLGWVSR